MTLRCALVGCGFFARNHMHAWAEIPGIDVVAVCDLDRAKAEDFARTFGAEPFDDPAAMLAAVRPDVTDVATTVASHRALVELAARHGSAAVCQKPFAESLDDARAMVEACRAAGVPLIVHENFRWQAPLRALAEETRAGAIGRPTFLRLSFRHAFDIYANQPYLAETEDLALMDVGLHLFDVARFLLGDVTRVSCATRRLNPRVKGDDAFVALLEHEGGALSSVECSFFTHRAPDPFPQTLALLEGSEGTAEVTAGYRLEVHRDGRMRAVDVEPAVPAWGAKPWHGVQDSVVAFQRHVVAVLEGRAEAQPSGAHNLETLAVTFAAREAARTGRSVDVPRRDPP